MSEDYLFKDETFKIIGICMDVHKEFGHGFLENVYKDAIELELIDSGIPYSREEEYTIRYKEKVLRHKYRSDFTLYGNVILEVKAQEGGLIKSTMKQTINYLKVSGCKVGLAINFGRFSLEYRRVILSHQSAQSA